MYQIRPSAGKGLGIFATQIIPRGTRIISDHSILPTFLQIITNPIRLYTAVLALPHNLRASYMDLAHTTDPTKRQSYLQRAKDHNVAPHAISESDLEEAATVFAIFNANAFNLDKENQSGAAIALQATRINHSCAPNAHQEWDAEGGFIEVYAHQDIQVGEEVTVTYVDPEKSWQERMDALRTCYDFECNCGACDFGT